MSYNSYYDRCIPGWVTTATILFFSFLSACHPEKPDPGREGQACSLSADSLLSFVDLQERYRGEVVEIREPWELEGIVISSDREDNIYGSLYIQDAVSDAGMGLEIRTDLLDIHTRFPLGSRIRFALNGAFLGAEGEGLVVGAMREVFGNATLDRLPALETLERISASCSPASEELVARTLSLDELDASHLHTLVRITGVEVSESAREKSFAEPQTETLIPLEDCNGLGISLVNSGYSEFHELPLPNGSGTATGILKGSVTAPRLLLRFASDLDFDEPGCEELFPPARSDQVLISELADPDNNPGARFLELYNASEEELHLRGWRLVRYTNANTEPGGIAVLDGYTISPKGTLVLTADPEVFENVYGMRPDIELRANGPADSNGDDTILLLNPFDEVSDAFGIPGEDGSGTAHEFEDGRAVRRPEIIHSAPDFQPEEWIIYNDTGKEGTIKNPQMAPEDFTPGRHPDPDKSS